MPSQDFEFFSVLRPSRVGAPGRAVVALDRITGHDVLLRVLPSPAAGAARASLDPPVFVHPAVAAHLDTDTNGDDVFLATALVDGETLAEVIGRAEAIPETRVLEWLVALCKAVAAAHAAGIVHGRLEPANVVIDRDGRLYVLAFEAGPVPPSVPGWEANPRYTAPEGLLAGQFDTRSDVFSIGAIAYELLAGAASFDDARVAVLTSGGMWEPVPLTDRVPVISRELAAAVHRALAHRAEDRFATAADLRDALVGPEWSRLGGHAREAAEACEPSEAVETVDWLGLDPHATPAAGPSTVAEDAALPPLEEVQFTVYRPARVRPDEWRSLLAFVHLAENPPDAPSGLPAPLDRVRDRAERELGPEFGGYRERTADARQSLPRESEITLVPMMPGVEFNPERRTFRWVQDVQEEAFLFRAGAHLDGSVARGRLSAYLGMILVADVPLAITVDGSVSPGAPERAEPVGAAAYRKIFASYSRRDTEIVEHFAAFARAFGDRYLIDRQDLRAGEAWAPAIRTLIDQADVFQLFWSSHVVERPEQVRQEWEYALSLGRPRFVRPTYWESPLPESKDAALPPASLRALQFERIGPSLLPAASGPPGIPPVPAPASPRRPDGPSPRPAPHADPFPAEPASPREPPAYAAPKAGWWILAPLWAAGIALLAVALAIWWFWG